MANVFFAGNEEHFDISKNERVSLIVGNKNSSKIRKFEEQTGAKIHVSESPKNIITLTIIGNSSQRGEAKISIRDLLERTSFIPEISFFVLTESSLNYNRLKFVKYTEPSNESNEKSRYFVEFLQQDEETDQIDEIAYRLEDYLHLTPRQFNTFDKIDDCLDRLSLKLESHNRKDSLFSEKIILKPRIFFGKVLFSNIDDPEDCFALQEWYKFSVLSGRGRRGSTGNGNEVDDGKNVNVEFQQDSPQIYEEFKKLQRKFGFKWDDEVIKGKKGSVYVYYTPSQNKKRKLKLRWNEEENRWKIASHSYGLNRLANIDIISGSKAPDFRLSLKTHYEIPSEGSKVEEVINKIQLSPNFTERDGMWFRTRDFDNTLIKRAVVRQVTEKKRFRNKDFLITFSTIKHETDNNISIQNIITFKHHTWAKKLELDNGIVFMNNVVDTFHYVQEMMNLLA